jgi:hypothetical protein
MTTPPEPTTPPAADPAPAPADRTFTQSDIDRIVAERVARERGKYADYDDLKAKAGEYEQLRAQSQTDQEKAIEAARAEGRSEVQTASNERLIRAEVRAAAAGKLADPADAVRLLDVSGLAVGDDGTVDAKALAERISQLVKDKPYLAAKTFQGTGDGGAAGREPANGPKQVTKAEIKTMSAEQIDRARVEGRLSDYLASPG